MSYEPKYYTKQKRDRPAKRVNIYLDEETYDKIRDHVAWCKKSVSEWVEQTCQQQMLREKQRG